MFVESVSNPPSIWTSMNSWFTPAVLFLLLNLMIGTVLFRSNLSTKKQQNQEDDASNDQHNPRLGRSPSLIKRIKSFNFKNFRSQEAALLKQNLDSNTAQNYPSAIETIQHQTVTTQAQYVFQHTEAQETTLTQAHESETQDHFVSEDELEDEELQSLDEVFSQLPDSNLSRTTSETKPASGQVPAKLWTKMKKSASMKSPFSHFEESDIVETRRPATVRERGTELDEEVDAKADDFINKFKQQLKLQRMDSIIRYKEDVSRVNAR